MAVQPPRSPGVYKITCLPTGKIYVGSSVDIRTRWSQHYNLLRRGEHHSKYLQLAWDKYGEPAFELTVLECVDPSRLMEAEQRWIDSTRCAERKYGYNVFTIAGGPGDAFAKLWDGFIDPAGNEVAPITNLKEFCRQNGLDATHMVAVLKGRICSHQGWTHRDGRRPNPEKTYYGFINPQGVRVTITNLSAFCEANGLSKVHMFNLISGLRKSHKGWIWRPDDEPQAS